MAIAALDLQAPGGGMPGAIGDAHAAVDAALAAGAGGVGSLAELRAALGEAERLVRRAEAVRLAVIREIDRRGAAASAGHTDTGSFVAMVTNTDRVKAAGAARLAADLEASATGAALARGEISSEHARVITQALADLPGSVDEAGRAVVEESLVRAAGGMNPRSLRRFGRRAIEAVEPDPVVVDEHENSLVEAQERAAWENTTFWMRDAGDGTTHGRFTVPTVQAHAVKKVLDAMTAPRRRTDDTPEAYRDDARAGGSPADAADVGLAGPFDADPAMLTPQQREVADLHAAYSTAWNETGDQGRRWQQLRGQAFASLIERIPTDHLHDKVAATVVVHVDLATLRGEHAKASSTDTGELMSAGELRRWAAGAGIIPGVLGGESVPLDLGQGSRCFTTHQRLALAKVYEECAAEHCGRPFAWCEIHHDHPWKDEGRTSLDNAIPLCPFHHRLIDQRPHVVEPADPPQDPRDPRDPSGRSRERTERKVVRFHDQT
ncbi:HNH endonuclease signature motif containing protein [Janibacter massiliensis]|uniref:HNH endonuclease signature motif containing protein n=1 Tax=Janibacter massiliensis TaxID=2058291 RepID=UPI000D102827|nr:HNH endonuclease signature motif containing protein [Janibacter massiliensis]